jgi:hypothetical protein
VRDHDDPTAALLFGALCFVALIAGVVWAGAALATLVSGAGALDAGLVDAVHAAVALPGNLTDPAAAWPEPASSQVPDPWLYWPPTVAMFAAAAWVVAAALRWRAGTRSTGPVRLRRLGVKGHARYASAKDLAPRSSPAG